MYDSLTNIHIPHTVYWPRVEKMLGGGVCGLVIRNIVALLPLLPLLPPPLNTLYRILLLIGLDSLVIHFIFLFHRSAD